MDPIELRSFLNWLEDNQRTFLCRKDQTFDGVHEGEVLVERYLTVVDLEEILEQYNDWKED